MEKEKITGIRIIGRNNYSLVAEQFIIGLSNSSPTQEDVARFLDLANEQAISRRGGSGSGAGAYVEALFDGDDPRDADSPGMEIYSVDAASNLPVLRPNHKTGRSLRIFINEQKRDSVWDGHNLITCPYSNAQELLERINS